MLTGHKNQNVSIDSKDMHAILFRNFSGKPDAFNPKGAMPNFTVALTDEKARELEAMGLNIKWRETPDGEPEGRLTIYVRYENFPPKVYRMIGEHGAPAQLDKDTVALLDNDDITDADLIVSPYRYEFGERTGVKAYLSRGYFTVAEDEFASKYMSRTPAPDDMPF